MNDNLQESARKEPCLLVPFLSVRVRNLDLWNEQTYSKPSPQISTHGPIKVPSNLSGNHIDNHVSVNANLVDHALTHGGWGYQILLQFYKYYSLPLGSHPASSPLLRPKYLPFFALLAQR